MRAFLHSMDPELRDLTRAPAPLVEAASGRHTGAVLTRCLGVGGMATVFLAERDLSTKSADLSPLTPRHFGVKIMQPSTARQLAKMNVDPSSVFVRETVALGRMMERRPPTEFVVGFYGSGHVLVEVGRNNTLRLPWLAIEFVDGGSAGTSFTDRVSRAPAEGIDPVRTLRLIRGLVEGVRSLHGEGVIHRDLKPDNVLVAGPLDDETPKLADCGIAKVAGIAGTVAAMTPAYAGPEQALSRHEISNPLIGPWTDVHALAAIVWFVLGGEDWCRGDHDVLWHRGERRSLHTASRLHPGFAADARKVAALDAVLGRGAAQRVPLLAWSAPNAHAYADEARALYPAMFAGPERFADVASFAAELMPLLEASHESWTAQAALESREPTALRPTHLVGSDRAPSARIREISGANEDELDTAVVLDRMPLAAPRSVVFQPDGRVLARFGDQLLYFVDEKYHRVEVPPQYGPLLEATRWLMRGPGGGFALVGPSHVLLIRAGQFVPMDLPVRPGGGEVGEIQAVVEEGRVFGVVTAETDDSNGGPELWISNNGVSWAGPDVLPLGGAVTSVAHGPYGYLVVGARKETKARALFLGFDHQRNVIVSGVNDKPPLRVAVCGAARGAWAAGTGFVLAFDKGTATPEAVESTEAPVAMALDLVGVPWLVTTHTVLRRHVHAGIVGWVAYYRHPAERAPLVGIGFTPEGARVLDARGNGVSITPLDIESWRASA